MAFTPKRKRAPACITAPPDVMKTVEVQQRLESQGAFPPPTPHPLPFSHPTLPSQRRTIKVVERDNHVKVDVQDLSQPVDQRRVVGGEHCHVVSRLVPAADSRGQIQALLPGSWGLEAVRGGGSHPHLIFEPVMSSSTCMRCLSPALLSLRLTVTGARKGFLASKGLETVRGRSNEREQSHTQRKQKATV